MVKEKLLRKMKAKFDEGPEATTLEDVPLLFDFSKQLIAENEEIKEEYLKEKINVQLVLSDKDKKYWIRIKDGDFTFGEGSIGDISFTLTADVGTFTTLIFGMNGALYWIFLYR